MGMPDQPPHLPGTERPRPTDERLGDADLASAGRGLATVYLRGPEPATAAPLSREAYATAHGPAQADVDAVRAFAARYGLAVTAHDPGRRSLELAGDLAALASAFGARLGLYRSADGLQYRAVEGPLSVPPELAGVVTGVFGLDERPQARPHFRPAATTTVQYTPVQVASAYRFPSPGTAPGGQGECVAIVELGGGFRPEDLSAYFSSLGLPVPKVEAVSVLGAANSPGQANGPDGEVMLDIEVVGCVAPGAFIAVYFAPNTDQGFIDAVSTAVHDSVRRPSVVSISWGSAESTWSGAAMQQMEQAFVAAAAMGVTVTVAAGDNGSSDGVNDGLAHVDFPASAPHALACGGTHLEAGGGAIQAETVWDDGPGGGATGGGVSAVFPVPTYQQGAHVPPSANPGGGAGRGVPDVCGDADPATGYVVRVDGQTMVIGGTSAVAPLWAGLVALLNQSLGRPVGFLHPVLYSAGVSGTLHDITAGSNGAYSARPGWDACTGLGSPDGAKLLAALAAG